MSAIRESSVLEALKVVTDPDLGRDIVSLGFVKNLAIDDGRVSFTIELTTPACPVKDQMRDQAQAAVSQVGGVTSVDVEMTASVRSAVAPDSGRAPIPGIKNIIAVGAGKGGVGKTTVAVNLAVALAHYGGRVGIIDGDVYGPNVPIMLGLDTQLSNDGKKIVPAEKYGIRVVSMGFLTDDKAPIIWRGPMLHGVVRQFFQDVRWGELDYLVIDMPPGTGDVALSLTPDGAGGGRDRCHHTAGCLARRQPAGGGDVPQARGANPRCDRKHVLLCLSGLRLRTRHLREGWRRGRCRGARRSISRAPAYLRAYSYRERHRHTDCDRGT